MNGATATEATIRNGVNVEDLLGAIEAVTADGENGKLTFSTSSRWLGGFRARHTPGAYRVGGEPGAHSADRPGVSRIVLSPAPAGVPESNFERSNFENQTLKN